MRLNKYLPLLCIIFICLIGIMRINSGLESFSTKYKNMTIEEKKLDDLRKINRIGILWFGSTVLVTALALVLDIIFKEINISSILIIYYVVDLIVYFFVSNTKCILDLFCKAKGGSYKK